MRPPLPLVSMFEEGCFFALTLLTPAGQVTPFDGENAWFVCPLGSGQGGLAQVTKQTAHTTHSKQLSMAEPAHPERRVIMAV
jgi:hypothetical protein